MDFSFETDATLDLPKIYKLILQEIAYYNPALLNHIQMSQ